ncbi:hypothetical protein [Streptomyces sp. NPDC001635]|nr:hypothetical protein E4K10_04410 [Streptomyces sp. T1317-0309]
MTVAQILAAPAFAHAPAGHIVCTTVRTLHDLRHSVAVCMVRDPKLTLADVQWVLGHAHLSATEVYPMPREGKVVPGALAHHERQAR